MAETRGLPIASRWRALAGFSLGFRLAEGLLFLPVAAVVGAWLAGSAVVETQALVPLLLSPRGLLLLVAGGTLFFLLRWFEHAGLSAILFAAAERQHLSAAEAARLVLARLPVLAGAALRVTLQAIAALLPLLLGLGAVAAWLLARHDINFYLKARPPDAIAGAAAIAIAAFGSVLLLLRLVGRVRLAVQVALFEPAGPAAALARSAELTRGRRVQVVLLALGLAGLTLGLGALAALAGAAMAGPLLQSLAGHAQPLLIAFALLVLVRAALGLAATWIASLVDAAVFTRCYRQWRADGNALPNPLAKACVPHRPRRLVLAAAALAALGAALSGLRVAIDALGKPEDVRVFAHRGLAGAAAENSLGAFAAAFAAGADAVETDVQQTRDGALVLVHDADLARVAGVPRRVADMTLAEVRAIRLPGSDPQIATLDELLRLAEGRGFVLIEPKTYRDSPPGLVAGIVAAIRAEGAEERVLVQSFALADLAEVARLAPEVPVGFLVAVPTGSVRGLSVDFLSVERMRVSERLIGQARRAGRQLFVWNVGSEAEVRRLVELGVDGLIVDDVAAAAAIRDAVAAGDPLDRTVRQMVRLLGG